MDAGRRGSYRRGMSTSTPTPPPPTPAAPEPATTPAPRAGRSPLRRLGLTAGIIVMVALFAYGAFAAVGFATLHQAEQHQSFTFTGSQLVVGTSNGSIHVTAGQPGRVEVDTHLRYSQLQPAHPTVRVEGGQLVLKDGCRQGLVIYCNVSFDLRVPAAVALQLSTSNGAVGVSGVTGALTVHTSNGSITTDGASGPLNLHTSNGAIRARDLHATVVDAATSNGSVTVSFLASPTHVGIRTSNGGVRVTVPRTSVAYKVDVSTDNGSRTVDVPTDPEATNVISVHTSNGSVRILRAA